MSTTTNFRAVAGSLALLAAVWVLAGCGAKPPGCSDPQTIDLVKHVLLDGTHREVDSPKTKYAGILPLFWANDPDHLFDKVAQEVAVTITGVTSEGYDSNARRNVCQGTLEVSKPAGFSKTIQYATQLVADGGDKFVLRSADLEGVAEAVQGAAINYWQWRRYADSWGGVYECEGLNGATAGPQGPYSMSVVAKVDAEWKITIDRGTRGGGIESLKGVIRDGGVVRLAGTGQNSPDDTWTTTFEGRIEGRELRAVGQIAAEGGASRACKLALQRGSQPDAALALPNSTAPASANS